MGLIQRVKSVIKGAVDWVTGSTSRTFFRSLGGSFSWFGKSKQEILTKSFLDNDLVYSGVKIITDTLKVCPVLLNKVVNEQKLKHYKQYSKNFQEEHQVRAQGYRVKALEEIEAHPLLDLLNNPNDMQTWAEFVEDWGGYYNTLRDAYIYLEKPLRGVNAGKVKKMYVLPSDLVEIETTDDFFNPISHYKFSYNGIVMPIPKDNIIHFKSWNPRHGDFTGLSPFDVGHKVVARNNANQTAQTIAYKNGGKAVLISSKTENLPMNQEQLDLLTERIREKVNGVENFRTFQATNGVIEVHPIGDTFADMQLIEADKADRDKIAVMLGLDPILLGDDKSSTYNGKKEAYKAMITKVAVPQMTTLIEKLSARLLPAYEEKLFLEPDTSVYPELQPDLKLMMEVYGKPRLTENEKRSIFKWDALPNNYMDEVIIEKGHILLNDIQKQNKIQGNSGSSSEETQEDDK